MRKEEALIHYLEEHIVMCLDDIMEGEKMTDFLTGEIYAYIECLEIILQRQGVDNKTLLALEAKYGIK